MGVLSQRAGYGEGEEYEMRAPEHPVYNVNDPREAAIVSWRVDCFMRYGFDAVVAVALANRRDIDRQDVEELIQRGASPAQVAGIVL